MYGNIMRQFHLSVVAPNKKICSRNYFDILWKRIIWTSKASFFFAPDTFYPKINLFSPIDKEKPKKHLHWEKKIIQKGGAYFFKKYIPFLYILRFYVLFLYLLENVNSWRTDRSYEGMWVYLLLRDKLITGLEMMNRFVCLFVCDFRVLKVEV